MKTLTNADWDEGGGFRQEAVDEVLADRTNLELEVARLKRQNSRLRKKNQSLQKVNSDLGWRTNPDQMGK